MAAFGALHWTVVGDEMTAVGGKSTVEPERPMVSVVSLCVWLKESNVTPPPTGSIVPVIAELFASAKLAGLPFSSVVIETRPA